MDGEELEQYRDFLYDITDIALYGESCNVFEPAKRSINKEDSMTQNRASTYHQKTFTWSADGENEFIARMKMTGQNHNKRLKNKNPLNPI